MRVMIVEDEPASAEYIAAILARYVPEADMCAMAENGEDALLKMDAARPDAVIADIAMPRMDGLALAAALKAKYPHVATIIVSGYQDFDFARAALRQGVEDYLLKPVHAQELAACLRRVAVRMRAPAEAESPAPHADETPFTPLERYVCEHLSETLTLAKLCRQCGVSQTTVNRLFRKYTGQSFLEYLTGKRVARARALLDDDPHRQIKAVAACCGFSDPLYFSKVFRNIAGCSPSEYAQRAEK